MGDRLLEMRGITKSFPGVLALNNVDFDLVAGECHVLVGENGAGKSTLMRILAGMYRFDGGEILLDGKLASISSPAEALAAKIVMIHQELNYIPEMTIAENIFVGREPSRFGILDRKRLYANAQDLLRRLKLTFDPRQKMSTLSVGEIQMVEIAKAISFDSRIIIMDEPTSAISEREVEHLFEFMRFLKAQGVAIVYISHKLDEILRVADRITVLRDGAYLGTYPAAEMDRPRIIELMVGREVKDIFPKERVQIGATVLSVRNLSKKGQFSDVSFDLKEGEILGIAGLMGAGRTELVETIFGIRKADSGEVRVGDRVLKMKDPGRAIRSGIAFVPEDRKGVGLNLKSSVRENISIVRLRDFCRMGIVDTAQESKAVTTAVHDLSIKTSGLNQKIAYLSGGNQQKVVIAKWLLAAVKIFIMDEPTRGIDVGAKAEIHSLIGKLVQLGMAVLMVSSELPEIMGICDRVLVMHEGRMRGVLLREELTQSKIMRFATGS